MFCAVAAIAYVVLPVDWMTEYRFAIPFFPLFFLLCAQLAGRTLADLVLGRDTRLTAMPWVNPADAGRRWEPEPLRWLGIKSRAKLMSLADLADYRNQGRRAALYTKMIDKLTP